MMAYSEQIKKEVKERLAKGEKVKQISEQTGISVATLYKWKKEIQVQNEKKNSKEERKEVDKEEKIASKEIKRLIKLGQLDKASKLTVKYPLVPIIQSQRVAIAIRKGEYKEAKRIGYQEQFKNNGPIQSQMITVAIRKGEYKEAKRIGYQEQFKNDSLIQPQIESISETKNFNNKNEQTSKILNQIATKLYYGKIDDDDIKEIKESREIPDFEKNLILLAIYEKQKDVAKVKRLVQNYKKGNEKSKNNKLFNMIMQRIQSKKTKIFDYGFYSELLHWEIDPELKDRYDREKKEEEGLPEGIIKRIQPTHSNDGKYKTGVTAQNEKKYHKGEQTRITVVKHNSRLEDNRNNFRQRIKTEPRIDNEEIARRDREIKYFGAVMEYLKEKRRVIYVKMQSSYPEIQEIGISQWDKMEALIEKVKDKKEDKEYLEKLYYKILRLQEKENGMDR